MWREQVFAPGDKEASLRVPSTSFVGVEDVPLLPHAYQNGKLIGSRTNELSFRPAIRPRKVTENRQTPTEKERGLFNYLWDQVEFQIFLDLLG
jgi:hypothetical protein